MAAASPHESQVEIVAHRGAGRDDLAEDPTRARRPAAPPENTLPAFARGWSEAPACELDLRVSGDDELVVIHDPTTGRTCDRDLEVAVTPLTELRRLDAGAVKGAPWTGVRLPTLGEVLGAMPEERRLYVELKTGPGVVEPLRRLTELRPLPPGRIVFLSFDLDTIAAVKSALPSFEAYLVVRFLRLGPHWRLAYRRAAADDARRLASRNAWLGEGAREGAELCRRLAELVRAPGVVVGSPAPALDGVDVSQTHPPELAEVMRDEEIAWGVWTVDAGEAAVRLAAAGAFQLTSNCPGDLQSALAFARRTAET